MPATADPTVGERTVLPVSLFLGLFIALLYVLPARNVVTGMGAFGRPSMIVAVGCAILWLLGRLSSNLRLSRSNPLHVVLGIYVAVYLLSYAAGLARGLGGVEARAADRSLLATLALCGLAALAADALRTRSDVDRVLRYLLAGGAFMAVVGEIQFVFSFDLTPYLTLPGVTLNDALISIGERGAFDLSRVAGTAGHYIEFGVLMAMLLPIALHYAVHPVRGRRTSAWVVVLVIAPAPFFSVSRSAIVALAVSVGVLLLIWRLRPLTNALAVILLGLGVAYVAVPGLFATFRELFTNWSTDASIQARLQDYATVATSWGDRPLLGRGAGTFVPESYILLDNQWLGTLVSGGLLGVLALALLFLAGAGLARGVRHRATAPAQRHLGQALFASFVAAAVASLFFDSLSFSTFAGTLFLLLGITAALWRIERKDIERHDIERHDTVTGSDAGHAQVVQGTAR